MPLANIKRRESVPGQGIAKLKHRKQKTVNSILTVNKSRIEEIPDRPICSKYQPFGNDRL